MATSNPLVRNGKYDGARNAFTVDKDTLNANAARLEMSPEQYTQYINEFVKSYSQNPLFAYEHSDLSHVPIDFNAYRSPEAAREGTSRNQSGAYNTISGRINITPDRDPTVMLRTLIHELNHAAMLPVGSPPADPSRYTPGTKNKEATEKFNSDEVTKTLNYAPQELAAFLAETTHPGLQQRAASDIVGTILKEWVARHPEVTSDLRKRSAQPTRPVTNHPQSEIEDTISQRLIQFLTGRSPRDRSD